MTDTTNTVPDAIRRVDSPTATQLCGLVEVYDDLQTVLRCCERLMTLLEEHRIVRPPHQTPAEFGDALTFLPNQAYDTIRKLTKLFYAVRYGDRQLDHDEQKDLESTVRELGPILAHRPAIR